MQKDDKVAQNYHNCDLKHRQLLLCIYTTCLTGGDTQHIMKNNLCSTCLKSFPVVLERCVCLSLQTKAWKITVVPAIRGWLSRWMLCQKNKKTNTKIAPQHLICINRSSAAPLHPPQHSRVYSKANMHPNTDFIIGCLDGKQCCV